MPADNVKSFEKESFRKRLLDTAAATVPDGVFAELVYEAMARFGISENDMRDAFGMSGGAIERWTMQHNLPQPAVRAKILKWISDKL